MKNQSKIRLIALATAVCASLTACGGAEQTEVQTTMYYTMPNIPNTTTVVSDIYAAPVETVTWGDDEFAETSAETEAVPETIIVSQFDRAGDFNEGYAIIEYGGASYVIDTAGNIITELPERSKDRIVYDGGLIYLTNDNVVDVNGKVIADKEAMEYDEVTGIWYGYVVLQKKVETLERTGYDYCILNTDGSVHLNWAANPHYSVRDEDVSSGTKELKGNFIQVTSWSHRNRRVVYNLETGEYHSTVGKYYNDYLFDEIVTFYDYGYAMIKWHDDTENVDMYDYNGNLIESINVYDPSFARDVLEEHYDTTWVYKFKDNRSNIIVDAYTRKIITFPFNVDNVKEAELYDCNRDETLYFLRLVNNEGSLFYAVADENGNYVVEPSTTRVNTCNEGIYTTENQIYKTDGTLIYTSEIDNVEINAFSDGYCYVDAYRYDFFVDINGSKLEVEFKTE